jgi:hypothetical protein
VVLMEEIEMVFVGFGSGTFWWVGCLVGVMVNLLVECLG